MTIKKKKNYIPLHSQISSTANTCESCHHKIIFNSDKKHIFFILLISVMGEEIWSHRSVLKTKVKKFLLSTLLLLPQANAITWAWWQYSFGVCRLNIYILQSLSTQMHKFHAVTVTCMGWCM